MLQERGHIVKWMACSDWRNTSDSCMWVSAIEDEHDFVALLLRDLGKNSFDFSNADVDDFGPVIVPNSAVQRT